MCTSIDISLLLGFQRIEGSCSHHSLWQSPTSFDFKLAGFADDEHHTGQGVS